MRAELCHFSGLISTPVTVCARFVMTVSQFVFSRQNAPPCIMTRRTHVSYDGLFFTVVNTRRYQPRSFIEAPCPTQRQGPKGRRWLVLHRVARQEATEARDPPKTTRQCDQGCQ